MSSRKQKRGVSGLSWGDGSGDTFKFSDSVLGEIHTFSGRSSVNGGPVERGRWVAAYSGAWPDGVLGCVAVHAIQEVGGIEGMTLSLGSAGGSSGILRFEGSVFVSGVAVKVDLGDSEQWYSVGDGVLGSGYYELPYTTLSGAVGSVGGWTHEVEVRVCVGGVCGVGYVRQAVKERLEVGGLWARWARWERVLADGRREVVSDTESTMFPLRYGDGWSSDGVSCVYECVLWGFMTTVDGVDHPVEELYSDVSVASNFPPFSGPHDSSDVDALWFLGLRGSYGYGDRGVSGADAGYLRVVCGVRTLWGFSTRGFAGNPLTSDERGGWGGYCHVTFSGATISGLPAALKGLSETVRGGKRRMPLFGWSSNVGSWEGVSYSVSGIGTSFEDCVLLGSDDSGLGCVPVALGLTRVGSVVWSTGGVEDVSGSLGSMEFSVLGGSVGREEYWVGLVDGVWHCGSDNINEYVGTMYYRNAYGLRFEVDGVEVARCGVRKSGCGLSGLLHVGVGGSESVANLESSMWVCVIEGFSESDAVRSGVRLNVGGVWFPSRTGFVGTLNGSESLPGLSRSYWRYDLRVIDDQLLGLYGGGLLGGGFHGGDVLVSGWENPRAFNDEKCEFVLVWGNRLSLPVECDCGGHVVLGDSVADYRMSGSLWLSKGGSVVTGIWDR